MTGNFDTWFTNNNTPLGGYSGINIARQMKGFVGSDLDSWYTLRTNLDGSRDGSLYNFTRTIASSMNIGIYEAELNYINTFNLSNPASDIDLCMAGEQGYSHLSICVQNLFNVAFFRNVNRREGYLCRCSLECNKLWVIFIRNVVC